MWFIKKNLAHRPTNQFRNCSVIITEITWVHFTLEMTKAVGETVCLRNRSTYRLTVPEPLAHRIHGVCVCVWEVDMIKQIDCPHKQLLQALMQHNNTHIHTHRSMSETESFYMQAYMQEFCRRKTPRSPKSAWEVSISVEWDAENRH